MKRVKNSLFWIVLLITLIAFFAIVFRNPFANNSLIPNLEPYPDTLYYATPAWNFAHGKGFIMSFEGHSVEILTPPLYSVYLIPFFAVFNDVRVFYFANLFLMVGSIYLFFLFCRRFFGNNLFGNLLTGFLAFFLITNFYFYTFPTLMMAENLSLFFVFLAIYLLNGDLNKRNAFLSGLLGVSFWLVKFSNLPLGAAFYFLYLSKLGFDKKNRKVLLTYVGTAIISFVLFLLYRQNNALIQQSPTVKSLGFDTANFTNNFNFYFQALAGGDSHFLWFTEKMMTPLVSFLSLTGLITGLLLKKYRRVALELGLLLFSLVIFMTFFYVADARYIFVVYPILLILAGITISYLKKISGEKVAAIFMIIFALIFLLFPGQGYKKGQLAVLTLAKQSVINYKHREDPWYYIAVTQFNQFFAQTQYKGSYLGTFLPPFLIDFYSNHTYKYLPLSKNQDFFSEKGDLSKALGISEVKGYYQQLLKQKKQVYVTNIYVTNLKSWVNEFEDLKKAFKFTLVHEGCYKSCNIYRIEEK